MPHFGEWLFSILTPVLPRAFRSRSFFPFILLVLALAAFTSGCGSGKQTPAPTPGNTRVTVVLSSQANDQLLRYGLTFTSINLVNQKGESIPLINGDMDAEFIRLNGGMEPLVTTSVPRDIYNTATITVGYASFSCLAQYPPTGGILYATYAYGKTPDENVTVNLPVSIGVSGDNMVLMLDLQVARSATFTCYNPDPFSKYSITPTFDMKAMKFWPESPDITEASVSGLDAKVVSIAGSNEFEIGPPDFTYGGATRVQRMAAATPGTTFQGIPDASALSAGTFVNLDATLQQDGSLLATRIAVQDPSAVNMERGPLLYVPALVPQVATVCGRWNGAEDRSGLLGCGPNIDFSNASFSVSAEASNLEDLPFAPVFNSNTMVAGQEVSISYTRGGTPANIQATARTITLMPQMLDGTIVGSTQSGAFTIYTASLANYNLFPVLASQPNSARTPTQPNRVQIYVDSNTQTLNTQALVPGDTFRFYGVVFYDNGTLRMDCLRVSDGVPQ